jgi:hypothetical protein
VLAGFLLVLGGGLIALGSQRDWLTAHLAGNESATLNVASSRFNIVILIFAGLIIVVGFIRVSRGFAKDPPLHQVASLASIATVVAVLIRTAIFLGDQSLSIGSPSSWTHLDPALGIYLLAGGIVVTLASRLA